MEKQITAGYLWQDHWTGPGYPIYPAWWSEKPSEDRPYHSQADYDRYQKEMTEYPAEGMLDIAPGTYTLELDYPLSMKYKVEVIVPEHLLTRQQLMDIAAEAYHKVYYFVNEGIYADGIDETSQIWNKYGIWGHSMGDLTIHTFYIDDETNTIKLGVDS